MFVGKSGNGIVKQKNKFFFTAGIHHDGKISLAGKDIESPRLIETGRHFPMLGRVFLSAHSLKNP
jgi:hypothetical protein